MRSLSSLLRGVHPLPECTIRVPVIQSKPADPCVTQAADSMLNASTELVASAEIEAQSIVEAARHEAESIVRAARDKAKEIVEEARQQGWRAGYDAGFAEGQEHAAQCVAEAQAVLEAARKERRELLKGAAPALTKVAMVAVRRLLARELALQAADIERMVAELLEYVLDSVRIEVRVHPNDFLAATEAYPRWRAVKFGDWEIAIIPDASITPGGCEIRSDAGRVDARMETKLELLEATIEAVIERSVEQRVETMAG
jgi:flagellar assembly protein FliH